MELVHGDKREERWRASPTRADLLVGRSPAARDVRCVATRDISLEFRYANLNAIIERPVHLARADGPLRERGEPASGRSQRQRAAAV